MEEIAAVLVLAFDAHEITVNEFSDAVRSLKPEVVQFLSALLSTASLVQFCDEQRRRYAHLVCSRVACASRLWN